MTAPVPVGWIHHAFFKRHVTGPDHPERPERLDAVVQGLASRGLLGRLDRLPFGPAGAAELARVHEPAYVELVRLACAEGFGYLGDPDTRLCPESYDVAALAAGGAVAACDAILADRVRRAFCAVRPPGHHAEPDRAMGYCLFNHAAVAAAHLIGRGLERVAVVDLDAHHGNGTQHAFEARRDVLYVSLHEHPLTLAFPGTGYRGETGVGDGEGYTRNVYLPYGCDGAAYLDLLRREVLPVLDAFAPQFLVLSAGFDAARTESAAHLNLEPESFAPITRELVRVAERHCRGRLVSVLEGGYEVASLGRAVAAHVGALLEDPAAGGPDGGAVDPRLREA